MIRVSVHPASAWDMEFVAAHMRVADLREVWASTALPPREALRFSASVSHETWAARLNGVPACIWGLGIGSALTGVARPWLLGTDAIARHPARFLRRSRGTVEAWGSRHPLLENWCDARNELSLRWLAWLGFTLEEPAPFGPFGFPFVRFWRSSTCA